MTYWGKRLTAATVVSSLLLLWTVETVDAFFVTKTPLSNVVVSSSSSSTTALFGAFNRRNKQADLMKKMQEAKAQREEKTPEEEKGKTKLSDEEIKEINDRKRFEELLNREGVTANNYDYGASDSYYLTKEQEEEDMNAAQRGVDRLFEGDPAPTAPFEDLAHITTDNAISKKGTKRLLPWLSSNSKDYLIIISDPRNKSSYMRKVYKKLTSSLSAELKQRLIFINADTPAENRKWLKKEGLAGATNIYSDEKREWMRAYTALGEKRWAICMFVVSDGRVQRIVRDLDSDMCVDVVSKAVRTLK